MSHPITKNLLLSILLLPGIALSAEPLSVAVASNFAPVAEEIATLFAAQSDHQVRISSGSTGKLYAQISNGAPYDVFLSADSERPALLEKGRYGVAGTRVTYALGSLVLWSADPDLNASDCRGHLEGLGKDRLAIANPATAPYGTAAQQFLVSVGLWAQVAPRLVYGENISQTLQFTASGNASMGLISRSQSIDTRLPAASCSWPVPVTTHAPIQQQALLLQRAADNTIAVKFLEFLTSADAHEIIVRRGYSIPQ